jgi:hypothetical protein
MAVKNGDLMPRKTTEPPSKPVRIHEDVYDGLIVLAAIFKRSTPQFTSEILRPIVQMTLEEHGVEFPIRAKEDQLGEFVRQITAGLKEHKMKDSKPKSGKG